MSASLITFKGWADILVAALLTIQPDVVYDNALTRAVSGVSGLHISDAATAPGFNQAIACMVAAVGVGQIVAGRSGPAAAPAMMAMYATWGILSLATCATSLGSATVLFTGINHLGVSSLVYYLDPGARRL